MSAFVLLNLLNELGKRDLFLALSLISSFYVFTLEFGDNFFITNFSKLCLQ